MFVSFFCSFIILILITCCCCRLTRTSTWCYCSNQEWAERLRLLRWKEFTCTAKTYKYLFIITSGVDFIVLLWSLYHVIVSLCAFMYIWLFKAHTCWLYFCGMYWEKYKQWIYPPNEWWFLWCKWELQFIVLNRNVIMELRRCYSIPPNCWWDELAASGEWPSLYLALISNNK